MSEGNIFLQPECLTSSISLYLKSIKKKCFEGKIQLTFLKKPISFLFYHYSGKELIPLLD